MLPEKFWKEALVVGVATMIVGLILTYIAMGCDKARSYDNWGKTAMVLLLTGAILHVVSQYAGWSKWYCTNGYACMA